MQSKLLFYIYTDAVATNYILLRGSIVVAAIFKYSW